MISTYRFALAALLLAVTFSAPAQKNASAGRELLEQLEKKYSAVRSVTGTFNQSLTAKAFNTTKDQAAQFQLLKPDNFRVDYQGASPSTSLISGRTFYQYVPSLKQVVTHNFRNQSNVRDLNYLLLGFGAKTEEILNVYNVSALKGGKGVRLTPRNAGEANFKYIDMQVSEDLIPRQFTMEQKDGNILTVNLNTGSLNMNANLSPADFRPNFPRDAQVVNQQ